MTPGVYNGGGGAPWPVGLYLVGMALATVVAVVLAAESRRSDLGDR